MVATFDIGIDVGTTNTCAYVWDRSQSQPESVRFGNEGRTHAPSAVGYVGASGGGSTSSDVLVAGWDALYRCSGTGGSGDQQQHRRLFTEFKYVLGLDTLVPTDAKDNSAVAAASKCFWKRATSWPFLLADGDTFEDMRFEVYESGSAIRFSVQDLYAAMLSMVLRSAVEQTRLTSIETAILTVPANFGQRARAVVVDAFRAAVAAVPEVTSARTIEVYDEPVAACVSYAKEPTTSWGIGDKVFVFDMGGGTLDMAVVERTNAGGNSSSPEFNVLHRAGVSDLGGGSFDACLTEWCISKLHLLRKHCDTEVTAESERAKIALTAGNEAHCWRLPPSTASRAGIGPASTSITQANFAVAAKPTVLRTRSSTKAFFTDAGLDIKDITTVLQTGGGARVRAVGDVLRGMFHKPIRIVVDEMLGRVACGAVWLARATGPAIPSSQLLLDPDAPDTNEEGDGGSPDRGGGGGALSPSASLPSASEAARRAARPLVSIRDGQRSEPGAGVDATAAAALVSVPLLESIELKCQCGWVTLLPKGTVLPTSVTRRVSVPSEAVERQTMHLVLRQGASVFGTYQVAAPSGKPIDLVFECSASGTFRLQASDAHTVTRAQGVLQAVPTATTRQP